MSTVPRKDHVFAGPALLPDKGDVLACPACTQEMFCGIDSTGEPLKILPLHMAHGRLCEGSDRAGAPPRFGREVKPPLTFAEFDKLSVSEILSADTCLSCGGAKAPGQTVCKTCYGMLPSLHQRAFPPYMKGYLFADEQKLILGHYTRKQFTEVFRSVLETLADLRSGNPNSQGENS